MMHSKYPRVAFSPSVVSFAIYFDRGEKMNKVDLTIIGAGSSGLVTALWAARQGLTVYLLDKKEGPLDRGHADGLEPRTLEIMDSLGIADEIWKKANKTVEICTWSDKQGEIHRTSRRPNYAKGTSRYREATLHQGHIERALVSALEKEPNVTIHWQSTPTSLEITNHFSYHTCPVQLSWFHRPLAWKKQYHSVRARYLVGCDGAHSWTRDQIGVEMIGDSTEELWRVIDIVPETDFPDIRCRCVIHNGAGMMMIIPREQRMARFYVDMSRSGSQSQDKTALFNEMVSRIRKIIMPYQIDFELCDWWSIYRIKQKLATRFVDPTCSVFLVGDAIHTHSPKAGQGMNTSIQDAWNLGWKLAACTKGQGCPALLTSYETERRPVAKRLLSFDKKVLGCFRSFCKEEGNGVEKGKVLEETIKEEHSSASGIEVVYRDFGFKSILEAPEAAPGIRLGYRIGDFNVVRHADGYVHSLHHVLPANGKWRAIVFPGDITQAKQKRQLRHVGTVLSIDDPNELPCLPNCLTMGIMAQCEAILIHASSRENVGLMDLPVAFRPWSESLGWDYDKVFADDSGTCNPDFYFPVYEKLGISKTEGCLVVVRPDQHVSFVGTLDTFLQVSGFLDTCH